MNTFVPGESVVFTEPSCMGDPITSAVGKHGKGPFIIASVEEVPIMCSCGGSLVDRDHTRGSISAVCPYGKQTLRQSVGHHQWVNVVDIHGTKIGSGKWAGSYFTPA